MARSGRKSKDAVDVPAAPTVCDVARRLTEELETPAGLENRAPTITELFLTAREKENISLWREEVQHWSIVHYCTSPIFKWLARFIPETVAPNVVTLAGLIAVVQSWYFSIMFSQPDGTSSPVLPALCFTSIIIFWLCHETDGAHASRTLNDTAMGELFKYVCEAASLIFVTISLLAAYGAGNQVAMQWYSVQIGQLVLMLKHYSAFLRESGMRYWLLGPGEVISVALCIVMAQGILGQDFIWDGYVALYDLGVTTLASTGLIAKYVPQPRGHLEMILDNLRFWYYVVFVGFLTKIIFSGGASQHNFTRWSLVAIVCSRFVPTAVQLYLVDMGPASMTQQDVIVDGLFATMVTADLIVANMAKREIHSWIIVMAFSIMIPQLHFMILYYVGGYFMAVFGDICWYMNVPLVAMCRNVYVDGTFDLCNVHHKRVFREALKHGNRLFVGVYSDKEFKGFARTPIMTKEERKNEVQACKFVTRVVENPPCFGITENFIRKLKIHVVCCGQEYFELFPKAEDDPYYGIPRQLGICYPLSRDEDFISKCKEIFKDFKGAFKKNPIEAEDIKGLKLLLDSLQTSSIISKIQAAQAAHIKLSPT